MRKILSVAAVAVSALCGASAQAELVTAWSYEVTSAWVPGQTLFSGGTGTQVNNTTVISWGRTGDPLALGSDRSGIVISGSIPATGNDLMTNGAPVATQTVTHINNSIDRAFSTLVQTGLSTSLTLTPFSPAGGSLEPFELTFGVLFKETPNTAPCTPGSVSVCDDIFLIQITSLENDFIYDGFKYTTEIVAGGGSIGPLLPQQCIAAGEPSGVCLGFTTQENAETSIPFGFRISAVPLQIPEPGSLALVGLALVGAGLTKKRRALKMVVPLNN